MEREGLKGREEVLASRSFALFLVLFCNVMCLGERSFLSFTSPQLDKRLMEGEGAFASVPEEQTCVFF